MSPYTLCIHLAIFASITHANPTLTNHVRKKIDFNHQAVPWPLFDPQDHQESLRIKRGNSADRKRFLEPPDIPTYIEGTYRKVHEFYLGPRQHFELREAKFFLPSRC